LPGKSQNGVSNDKEAKKCHRKEKLAVELLATDQEMPGRKMEAGTGGGAAEA